MERLAVRGGEFLVCDTCRDPHDISGSDETAQDVPAEQPQVIDELFVPGAAEARGGQLTEERRRVLRAAQAGAWCALEAWAYFVFGYGTRPGCRVAGLYKSYRSR